TVHHYLRLGLLPRPDRSGRHRFLYDERHVRALTLIRLLRERRRLPLDAIRKVLPDLLDLDGRQAFRPDMWDRVAGVRLSAAAALAGALEPRLPLFLDLFTRAMQRRPGYASESRRVFSTLAYEVGELLGAEDPVSGGAWLLGLAAAGAFRRALEPSPLASVD